MPTGFRKFTIPYTNDFASMKHELIPREEDRNLSQMARVYLFDLIEYLEMWSKDKECLPIPNHLKYKYVYLMNLLCMSPDASDEEYRAQSEFMLNKIDKVQAAQREYERKSWNQFMRDRTVTRRDRAQGMTFDVANIFAAHGSGTSERKELRKEFLRYAAAHGRVYQRI